MLRTDVRAFVERAERVFESKRWKKRFAVMMGQHHSCVYKWLKAGSVPMPAIRFLDLLERLPEHERRQFTRVARARRARPAGQPGAGA